jgi:hypothetical protein
VGDALDVVDIFLFALAGSVESSESTNKSARSDECCGAEQAQKKNGMLNETKSNRRRFIPGPESRIDVIDRITQAIKSVQSTNRANFPALHLVVQ